MSTQERRSYEPDAEITLLMVETFFSLSFFPFSSFFSFFFPSFFPLVVSLRLPFILESFSYELYVSSLFHGSRDGASQYV